ncbi:MAG: glycosyltransferase [Acidobacteriota bacterium]|nr:glycosyltransferase [Acidobacteriota bacterium]
MLSIIIPTFNRASFLREAIQSVLDQDKFETLYSSGEIEILIVDDGSSDETKEVVKEFSPRVKYYYQTHKGVSSARNKGLELAKGNLIAYLDSDDLWKNDKLRIQMNFMNAFPRAVVCYTEEIWIRRGVFVNPKKKHKKYSGWIFDKVLPICLLSLSSAMFRREVFDKVGCFDEEFPACEDYDFGIRVAQKYPVHLIKKPLIVKRGGHPDQLSRKYWGMDRFRIMALEKALTLDLTLEQRRLVEQELIKKCQVLVAGYKKRNKIKDAQKYLQLIDKYK